MLTLQLKSENKVEILHKFIEEQTGHIGGLVMALIISPEMESLMLDFNKEGCESSTTEFHLAGYYNRFKFPVYIDPKLATNLYLIGNNQVLRVEVVNG